MRSVSLLVAAAAVLAAGGPLRAQSCDCNATFEQVTTLVRQNYSGWQDKVARIGRDSLDHVSTRMRARAGAARTDQECARSIQEWMAFFEDGHLGASYDPPSGGSGGQAREPDAVVRARFAGWRRVRLSEAEAAAYLDANRARLDPAEGIWQGVGAPYRLAIVRQGGELIASVLKADSVWWTPGQVKAVLLPAGEGGYAARFYMRDHGEQRWRARVQRNVLSFDGATYLRTYPRAPGDVSAEQLEMESNSAFRFRRLGDSTVLVQVPSMDHVRKAELDSLIHTHRAEILATPNLVIDVRGNGGGSDVTYEALSPLLFTDTVRSVSASFFASPLNIANVAKLASDTTLPASVRSIVSALLPKLRAHPGEFVSMGEDEKLAYDTVYPLPRRVAVVVDRGCASSCEQFLLEARQSRKVTIYGENSAGVLDYSNVFDVPTVCPVLVARLPTTRSNRLPGNPIDPGGIAPNVRLPAGEVLPLEWVRGRLETPNRSDGSEEHGRRIVR